eukprot:scaffold87326_cov19-Tisochrysis_lutea.AAC.2
MKQTTDTPDVDIPCECHEPRSTPKTQSLDTRHMHATGVMSLAGLNGHQTYASNWCSSHGQTASGVQIGPH